MLYSEFLRVVRRIGPITVNVNKTRISFQRRVRFAGVAGTTKDALVCGFWLNVASRVPVSPEWSSSRLTITFISSGLRIWRTSMVRWKRGSERRTRSERRIRHNQSAGCSMGSRPWPAEMEPSKRVPWLLSLALCALTLMSGIRAQSAVSQQSDCSRVRPLSGSPSQYRSRGNRCEGLYEADVGSLSLDLLSFTVGPLQYELKQGVELEVSAGNKDAPVNVRAVAKPLRTYYQMDATLAPGSSLIWPVSDVLLPEGLTADRIGVFGWKGPEAAKIFVPISVVRRGAAHPAGQPVLTVRPSSDAQAIKSRVAERAQGRCARFSNWVDQRGAVLAGEPVAITLANLTGSLCIEVAASSETSNEWSTINLRVDIRRP